MPCLAHVTDSDNNNITMTEKVLLDEIKANRTPSVQYVLFNKDSIIKRYAFGLADINNGIEANQNTTYNAYSVTKTFTALAVLQVCAPMVPR